MAWIQCGNFCLASLDINNRVLRCIGLPSNYFIYKWIKNIFWTNQFPIKNWLQILFRSPSRMAISRSYPGHFFTFHEKKHSASFFSFASFSFKKDPTFHKNASFLLHLVSYPLGNPPSYPPGYPLRYPSHYLPSYPYGCQMLPNQF